MTDHRTRIGRERTRHDRPLEGVGGPNLFSDLLVAHTSVGDHPGDPRRLTLRGLQREIRALREELDVVGQPDQYRKSVAQLRRTWDQDDRYLELLEWLLLLQELHDLRTGRLRALAVVAELAELEPTAPTEPGRSDETLPVDPKPPDRFVRLLIAAPSAPPAGRIRNVRPAEAAAA